MSNGRTSRTTSPVRAPTTPAGLAPAQTRLPENVDDIVLDTGNIATALRRDGLMWSSNQDIALNGVRMALRCRPTPQLPLHKSDLMGSQRISHQCQKRDLSFDPTNPDNKVSVKLYLSSSVDNPQAVVARAFEEASWTLMQGASIHMFLVGFAGGDPDMEAFLPVWSAVEALYKAGKVQQIGVYDFRRSQLRKLMAAAAVPPHINHIHVGVQDSAEAEEMLEFAQEHNIALYATAAYDNTAVPSSSALSRTINKFYSEPRKWSTSWVAKYQVTNYCRNLVQTKGYLLHLQAK